MNQVDTERLLNQMAEAFIKWPLPSTLHADTCASDPDYPHRTGTNLMSYTEAKEMFRAVVLPLIG